YRRDQTRAEGATGCLRGHFHEPGPPCAAPHPDVRLLSGRLDDRRCDRRPVGARLADDHPAFAEPGGGQAPPAPARGTNPGLHPESPTPGTRARLAGLAKEAGKVTPAWRRLWP